MKKKLLVVLPVLLVAGGLGFKLSRPAESEPKPKVAGDVYILPKEFLLNLRDQRFAKLTVALVMAHGEGLEAEGGGEAEAAKPPEGYGLMPQEALVRAVVTEVLTGARASELLSESKRLVLKKRLKRELVRTTDVHPEDILFTDVTVQ